MTIIPFHTKTINENIQSKFAGCSVLVSRKGVEKLGTTPMLLEHSTSTIVPTSHVPDDTASNSLNLVLAKINGKHSVHVREGKTHMG